MNPLTRSEKEKILSRLFWDVQMNQTDIEKLLEEKIQTLTIPGEMMVLAARFPKKQVPGSWFVVRGFKFKNSKLAKPIPAPSAADAFFPS